MRNAILIATTASLLLQAQAAAAERAVQVSFRELDNVTHFRGVEQSALEARGTTRQSLFGRALDWVASVGTIRDRSQAFSFASVGGALSMAMAPSLELTGSFSPTWLEADHLNQRPVGGHFHFTSVVALRGYLDRRQRVALALRLQHTSNGGLNEANPGLDLAGVELSWRFDDEAFRLR